VDKVLDDGAVQLVNADPPRNVWVASWTNNSIVADGDHPTSQQRLDIGRRGKRPIYGARYKQTEKFRPKDRPLVNDFISDEEFARLLRLWFGNIQRVWNRAGLSKSGAGTRTSGTTPTPSANRSSTSRR